jgi:hypothetical protein
MDLAGNEPAIQQDGMRRQQERSRLHINQRRGHENFGSESQFA